jgi:hypothetical protein
MGNEQWAMSNGQWAMGNGQWPASQPASGKSGGQGVDFQLSGRACRRGRSANGVGKRISKPLSATPEATRNRPEIDSKSTPNRPRAPPGRPGGPRGRFRTHSRVPGPPETYRAPPGGPKIGLGQRSRLAGGGPGAISGAPRARRERSARAARAILGPSRHPRGPKRRSGAILVRFSVDFGSIFGLFVEFLRRCGRSSCVKGRPRVRIAFSHTKRRSDLSRARREATGNRPKIAAGALPERVARKIAENRPKSSKVGPEIDPAALGKAASGPSGRLCGSPGALGGAR